MTTIYHFCNDFGKPFRGALRDFSRRRGLGLVTVRSSKNRRPTLKNRLADAADALRGVVVVPDVNAASFADGIPAGAIGVITGFNQIFRAPAIAKFRTFVNVHPSVLPAYAGRSPVEWAIGAGETKTGFTIHEVTPAVDSGPILYQSVVEIGTRDVLATAAQIGGFAAPALLDYLSALLDGRTWQVVRIDPSAIYRAAGNASRSDSIQR